MAVAVTLCFVPAASVQLVVTFTDSALPTWDLVSFSEDLVALLNA